MKHLLLIITLISFLGINHKAEAKRVAEDCYFLEFNCVTIFDAAEEGDYESVKQYIAQGGDVNIQTSIVRILIAIGITPLHLAAEKGHTEIVELLIDNGANAHARTDRGANPLHLAADRGHAKTIELLIEKGVEVNSQTYYGQTPLHLAAYKGYKEIAELLIEKGADVNLRNSKGRTPLGLAGGNPDMINFLISKGATY